jgi:hypothetical protein
MDSIDDFEHFSESLVIVICNALEIVRKPSNGPMVLAAGTASGCQEQYNGPENLPKYFDPISGPYCSGSADFRGSEHECSRII